MKILHVIFGLPQAAGTTVFCLRVMEEQKKQGQTVAVWLPGEPPPFVPDILHVHGLWVWHDHKAQVWARKKGARIVLSPHGMLAPWALAHKRWKKFLPWHLYQKGDVSKADLIHTTSEQETKWIRNLGFTNSIVEVPLGTDLPNSGLLHSIRNDGIRTLLFVGRIYPVKGLDLFLKAWAEVKESARKQNWRVELVGPDQAGYLQTLKRLCEAEGLKVGDDVLFTGPLYGDDINQAYLNARALILPSYSENFGGVVVDAMSFGLPVLTSEATPWNFLQEKGCGWHFPLDVKALAEKLTTLFATPDDALCEMGARGRQLVANKYTWPAIAEQMKKAYEGLGVGG